MVSDGVFAAAVTASVVVTFLVGFSSGALSRTLLDRCIALSTYIKHVFTFILHSIKMKFSILQLHVRWVLTLKVEHGPGETKSWLVETCSGCLKKTEPWISFSWPIYCFQSDSSLVVKH